MAYRRKHTVARRKKRVVNGRWKRPNKYVRRRKQAHPKRRKPTTYKKRSYRRKGGHHQLKYQNAVGKKWSQGNLKSRGRFMDVETVRHVEIGPDYLAINENIPVVASNAKIQIMPDSKFKYPKSAIWDDYAQKKPVKLSQTATNWNLQMRTDVEGEILDKTGELVSNQVNPTSKHHQPFTLYTRSSNYDNTTVPGHPRTIGIEDWDAVTIKRKTQKFKWTRKFNKPLNSMSQNFRNMLDFVNPLVPVDAFELLSRTTKCGQYTSQYSGQPLEYQRNNMYFTIKSPWEDDAFVINAGMQPLVEQVGWTLGYDLYSTTRWYLFDKIGNRTLGEGPPTEDIYKAELFKTNPVERLGPVVHNAPTFTLGVDGHIESEDVLSPVSTDRAKVPVKLHNNLDGLRLDMPSIAHVLDVVEDIAQVCCTPPNEYPLNESSMEPDSEPYGITEDSMDAIDPLVMIKQKRTELGELYNDYFANRRAVFLGKVKKYKKWKPSFYIKMKELDTLLNTKGYFKRRLADDEEKFMAGCFCDANSEEKKQDCKFHMQFARAEYQRYEEANKEPGV